MQLIATCPEETKTMHAMARNTERTSAICLNLVLGNSAAGTFRLAFGSNENLLVDPDVLSCGPTPRRDALDAWRVLRRKYWADLAPDVFENYQTWPNDVLENVPSIGDADRVVIWAATGLSEQLFIASCCNLVSTANAPLDRAELVQFEYLPNRRVRIIGLGELDEVQIRNHPKAVRLTQDALAHYIAAWDALTSPDPRAIECFAENNPSASEWLKDAMRLMLRRFPDVSSGLAHSDFRLLAHVREHGPRAVRVIGHMMAEGSDDADPVGDYYLFGRLLRMCDANLPMPLLRITGDASSMRTAEVDLTPFGLDVLEGRASNVLANPIEGWAAGTQLSSSRGTLWFRDGNRVIAPASGAESDG